MKFTLSWLKEHLQTQASLEEITDALTDLGLEVEEIINPAAKLADFTIGKVIKHEQHPDADKLRVCMVETNTGISQIICGAPNARAGITVVVAKPGDYIPGIDKTIGVGKIRGVESHGMMCSERELELSDEHDGIIELPSGTVGQSFAGWLAQNEPLKVDPVIEIAITPNRPDALGVRGIARDLAARGLGTLKSYETVPVQGIFPCPVTVSIDDDARDACPVFMGRVIRGVKNGPSPEWLVQRLRLIGLRPINFLVDVTNFFTYDVNRPLHVFDADKVQGNLRVHLSKGGETLMALDGKEYSFEAGAALISDDNGTQSIGGVMGGLASGSTEETVNVFIEAAYFDPIRTAYTGRALKINSDARYRFERGIDPAFTQNGLERATQMILDIAGGTPSDIYIAGEVPNHSRHYTLDTNRVQSLVGMEIAPAEQKRILTALGFKIENDQTYVPSWRPDVKGTADLVEEVARVTSLSKLKGQPLPRSTAGVTKPVLTAVQQRVQRARRTMAMIGYNECISYSFIDHTSATLFGGGGDATMLDNPISNDMSHMRPSLLPGLLQVAARNQARGFADMALFELGPVWQGGEPEGEETMLAGILVGHTCAKDMHKMRRAVDVYDAKADTQALLAALGAPQKVQYQRGVSDWWHPGRAARMALGKTSLAVFGEIHPKILQTLNVKGPAVGFGVHLQNIPLPKKKTTTRAALQFHALQAVERDFAFVMDQKVEAITAVNAAQGANKALIESVRVFDEYIGGTLGEGKKSLALTVRLQSQDATLKDAEIEAISAQIIEKVIKATGGQLRD